MEIKKNTWLINYDAKKPFLKQLENILQKYNSRNEYMKPKEILILNSSFGFRMFAALKKHGLPIRLKNLSYISTSDI